MNSFEQIKDILTQNGFKVAKQYNDNTDFCSKTSLYMYDYNKRQCKLLFIEYHGVVYSYQTKLVTEKTILLHENTGYKDEYYRDAKPITQTHFWDLITLGTKPPEKPTPRYEQTKINIDAYIDKK